MSALVLLDTSVLLNILDVPGRNQHRDAVFAELARLIQHGDLLFIPMAAIIETGNHIAHIANGDARRKSALRFADQVRAALRGEAPWKPINFPEAADVLHWLDEFPSFATRQVGLGDLSIRKEWERLCRQYHLSRVRVWTLDHDLADLDRLPKTR